MLRQRVITALILLPPVVAMALWLPDRLLGAVIALAIFRAAWEWIGLAGRFGMTARIAYAAATALLAYVAATAHGGWVDSVADLLLWVAVPAWGLAPIFLARYPGRIAPRRGYTRLILGGVLLPAAAVGMLRVRHAPLGMPGLLLLLVLVWAADIAAYFAGHAFGRHRLAPALSPGKTWEGLAGGMLGAVAIGVAADRLLPGVPGPRAAWLVVCLATAAISVVGDLCESLMKRLAGVKDSGRLLPGHGGLLDRIDSLIAAAPIFAVGLWLLA